MPSFPLACTGSTLQRMADSRMRPLYRFTSLTENSLPLGPYGRPMSKAQWWS